MQWFENMKQWILDHAPSHPSNLGADQVVNTNEPSQVPQVQVYVLPEYDKISNENFGTSNFGSAETAKTPLPEPTYYNSAGLKSDINGNALMNDDRTYTDKDGHTIMSDANGYAIMPESAPQYYDWYTPPGTLGADQTVNNEAVLPSQEPFPTPEKWLENKRAQAKAEEEYQPIKSPEEWLAERRKREAEGTATLSDKALDFAAKMADTITKPATMALEGISYFGKPEGALAGAVKAAEDGTPIWEGAKQGWQNNTSWKETFSPEWVKENPKKSAVAGFAADVVADPLWLLPPAKIAAIIGKGSKAVGLTDKIAPIASKIANSETGQKTIAALEDFAGKNRIADDINDMKAAHARDIVNTQAEVMPEVKALKKEYGDQADNLTNYIEAAAPDKSLPLSRDIEKTDVIDMYLNGSLPQNIRSGIVSKEQALNTLREVGEKPPDYLLQDAQKYAKDSGQEIPDTVYRDQVLAQIPDEKLRKAVQAIGDKFIGINKQMSDKLGAKGLLSDEQMIRFDNGSHLRRSFEQYENPEKFLEAVRKNGTPEEYRRVYQSLDRTAAPGSQGYSQTHKVNMQDFVGRQNLSDETMQKLGLITDPEYKIMDTIKRGSKDLRESEFLEQIANKWGKTADEAADLSRTLPERRRYTQMPESKAYGALAGKWVPKDIADQVIKVTGNKEEYAKMLQKAVSYWKAGKLVNPASVARNFYSGVPMANVFGGVPFQSMPKYMAKATQAFTQKYKSNLYKEAKSTGVFDNEWSKQELQNIIGENPKGIKKYLDMGMTAFGSPDQFWRMVTYSYQRDHGKSTREAAEIANRALFDYSNAPPIIDAAAKYGIVPFAKFPYYAAKETGRALYNKPAQVTKYTKIQNQDNAEDRDKIMPDYMKAKQLLPLWNDTRIVNGKPQPVQKNLDISYILPFANDVSLGNPFTDALTLSTSGKNGLGQQVIKPGMTDKDKAKVWGNFLYNSVAPAFPIPMPDKVPLPSNYAGEKIKNAWNGEVDSKGRQYDLGDAVAQTILGLKNVPINTQEMYNQKIKSIEFEQKSIKSQISQIRNDKSVSTQQKAEKIKDLSKNYKELESKRKEADQSYKRLKEKGAI